MKISPCVSHHLMAMTVLLMAARSSDGFTAPTSHKLTRTSLSSTPYPQQQQQQQQQFQQQPQQQLQRSDGGKLDLPDNSYAGDGFLKGDSDNGSFLNYDPNNIGLATPDDIDMFPIYPELELIQGGGTVKTYKMPPWAERCQMLFRTTGRPIKAKAELWLGPRRTTHQLHMNVENGDVTPIQATLKFKKASQVLKITTTGSVEFPVLAGVFVPPPGRAEELRLNTERIWKTCTKAEKKVIQGGIVQDDGKPGPGAYRYWNIPEHVKSVQILAWSIDTGKKSFKADIEVLQGPNTNKQQYFLQCGGGSQPYHGVFQTPGDACIIGIRNKKFLEDGLTQFAVVPYEVYQ